MKVYWEKRVVVFAIVTTIIAFWLVYFLYFNQKRTQEIFDTISFFWSWENNNHTQTWENSTHLSTSWVSMTWDMSWDQEVFNLDLDNVELTWNKDDEKLSTFLSSLSWIKLESNNLDSINLLWIWYKFLLKKDDIYFAHISSSVDDIVSKVEKLWWNSVEIKDKKVILDNYLTWDNVFFLNIPEYKNKRVLLVVYFEKKADYWFIQIPYEKYYKSKPILRQFFSKYDL